MQHLDCSPEAVPSPAHSAAVRARVRFLAYHRIKPHVPPLVRAPVNFLRLCGPPSIPLSFSLAAVLPRWMTYRFRLAPEDYSPKASHHRLRRGLPGYLILFDPHAFVPQRRSRPRQMPPQSVFCAISMHFTATPHIPPAATVSQPPSIIGSPGVERRYFTADLKNRLRTL